MKEMGKIHIADLDLSARAKNYLINSGRETLEDITSGCAGDLLEIRGIGRTTFDEIYDYISDLGLSFNMKTT